MAHTRHADIEPNKLVSVHSLLDELFSLHRFGIKPGLATIRTLSEVYGNPHKSYPVIHVAGTNGKGTVCSLLASILMSAGYRVGLYTSPHIRTYHERMRVNGVPITDEAILALAETIMPTVRAIQATFFEVTTAMMFRHFADANVDIAIIETGMGGRLDSTNIVEPLLSIITSIDFDHTEFLGNTLEHIAGEKAGIIKRKTPVLIAEPRKELVSVFMEKAVQCEAPIGFLDALSHVTHCSNRRDCSMMITATILKVIHENLYIPLAGKHQQRNILTALTALAMLKTTNPSIRAITDQAIRDGIANVHRQSGLQARIQCIREEPPLIVDVGHNLAGIIALRDTLFSAGYGGASFTIIFGAMRDKPVLEMLKVLKSLCAVLVAVQPATERAMSVEEIRQYAVEAGISVVKVVPVIADAMQFVLASNQAVLVVGSFYVVDEALAELQAEQISF